MRVWGKGTSDYKTREEQEMQVILGGSGLTESGIHVFLLALQRTGTKAREWVEF